jgi:hypothetical protein
VAAPLFARLGNHTGTSNKRAPSGGRSLSVLASMMGIPREPDTWRRALVLSAPIAYLFSGADQDGDGRVVS